MLLWVVELPYAGYSDADSVAEMIFCDLPSMTCTMVDKLSCFRDKAAFGAVYFAAIPQRVTTFHLKLRLSNQSMTVEQAIQQSFFNNASK